MNPDSLEAAQCATCAKYEAPFQRCDLNLKVGISHNIDRADEPINGLRVKEENGTSGWYIWSGEWSNDPNFFIPIHGWHLIDRLKSVLPFLGLAEGWRFLIANGIEDVWKDEELDLS